MKKGLITTKINPKTEGKLRIEGVGTFVPELMKGVKKADLKEQYGLNDEQHEILWKAVSKGEMPEPEETV